jgi:hypothetical protein
MTTLDVLKAARERISDPARWTQGDYARLLNDEGCGGTHPEAVKWCAYGALSVAGRPHIGPINAASDAIESLLADDGYCPDLVDFNDTHTHAEVLALFDAAIAAESTKGA